MQTTGYLECRAPMAAVLSVLTGHLMGPLSDLYRLQDVMAGRELTVVERSGAFTCQRQAILASLPALAEIPPPLPEDLTSDARVRTLVAATARSVGWCELLVVRRHAPCASCGAAGTPPTGRSRCVLLTPHGA